VDESDITLLMILQLRNELVFFRLGLLQTSRADCIFPHSRSWKTSSMR